MPSRNAEERFSVNPTNINISRSRFNRSSTVKFSGLVGDLIPFFVDEVLPGDTFDMTTSRIVRMQPMVTPPMDDLYLDTYYFFVPNRLVWEHWKEFQGENTQSAWIPSTSYSVPQVTAPSGGWQQGSVADYMGIPIGLDNISVNALPFRAYALIWNEFFRDQNVMDPGLILTNDTTLAGTNNRCDSNPSYACTGGLPFRACKLHDYFTSCLPAPQKGPDVPLPISQLADPYLPVVATDDTHQVTLTGTLSNAHVLPVAWQAQTGLSSTTSTIYNSSNDLRLFGLSAGHKPSENADGTTVAPSNLWALNDSLTWGTVNQLRMAFQIQRAYERDSRSGTRYGEQLKGRFGVTSPDARLQRPEYLGGNRLAINVNQIVQQSASGGSTPQGNPVGLSVTHDSHHDFTRSFTEHGFVIGLCVARYPHTYQQGIERFWSRKTRFDYYEPVFANIGEMAVKNKEIYAQGSTSKNPSTGVAYDDEVFGYQEAWADYRYKPSRVAGQLRSDATGSLDVWHFADDYSSMPYLSDTWMREDYQTIDRVLSVASTVSDQYWCDVLVGNTTTRPMPLYSIPGLLDHN